MFEVMIFCAAIFMLLLALAGCVAFLAFCSLLFTMRSEPSVAKPTERRACLLWAVGSLVLVIAAVRCLIYVLNAAPGF